MSDSAATTLRLTVVMEYPAHLADYGKECDGDPEKMAALDQQSLNDGEMTIEDVLAGNGEVKSYTVEVVQ